MGVAGMMRDWVAEYGPIDTDDTFRPGRFGVIGRDRLLRLADMVERLERLKGREWPTDRNDKPLTVGDSNCTHYHAPTVEDVLREFAQEMNENMGMYTGEAIDADEWRDADAKTVAKFAAKLRLRGDAE